MSNFKFYGVLISLIFIILGCFFENFLHFFIPPITNVTVNYILCFLLFIALYVVVRKLYIKRKTATMVIFFIFCFFLADFMDYALFYEALQEGRPDEFLDPYQEWYIDTSLGIAITIIVYGLFFDYIRNKVEKKK